MSNAPIPAPGPQTEATREWSCPECGSLYLQHLVLRGALREICMGCGTPKAPPAAAASPEGAQTEGTDDLCGATADSFACNRPLGHDGDHEDRDLDGVCVGWAPGTSRFAAASTPERAGRTTACPICLDDPRHALFHARAAAPTPEPGDLDPNTRFALELRRTADVWDAAGKARNPELADALRTAAQTIEALTSRVASLVAQGQRTAEQLTGVSHALESLVPVEIAHDDPAYGAHIAAQIVDELVDVNAALRADLQRTAEERDAEGFVNELLTRQIKMLAEERGYWNGEAVRLNAEAASLRDRLTRAEEEKHGKVYTDEEGDEWRCLHDGTLEVRALSGWLPRRTFSRADDETLPYPKAALQARANPMTEEECDADEVRVKHDNRRYLAALSTPSAPEATT